jgi:nucleotide-binding universal stress UspA family protein
MSAEPMMSLWLGVVAGFDGTDRSRCAVRWAAGECATRRCPLHVVRVVEPSTPVVAAGWMPVLTGPDDGQRDELEDQLVLEVERCRAANPGLEIHATLHDGPPSTRLAEHADQVGADVLAVGASDLGAVSRLVFGSTGGDLIRTTRRPVVAVRDLTPVQQATLATGYAPVVALADDRATSMRVLGFACDLADGWGATVTVVHTGQLLDDQLEVVRREHPRVSVEVETVAEQPVRAILDRSVEARLVVVGDRRHGIVGRWLTGSTSQTVLHHARCSVAVVP